MHIDREDTKRLARERLRDFLNEAQDILEKHPPERWWKVMDRYLSFLYADRENFEPQVTQFLEQNLEEVFASMEAAKIVPSNLDDSSRTNYIAEKAQEVIHSIGEKLQALLEEEAHDLEVEYVTLDGLVDTYESLQFAEREGRRVLQIQRSDGEWFDFPLPIDSSVYHKGGAPRVVLKILAGATQESIDAELPPNDFDILVMGDKADEDLSQIVQSEAQGIGVDSEGIEYAHSEDIKGIMTARDISLNQCLLNNEGLVYSAPGFEAAKTGVTALTAGDRGIYGSESFYYDGEPLAKNRGLYRLLKFVAEGKAESFEFTPLNRQVQFGIYWLVLARKFARKDNAGELVDKLYYLGDQAGQVDKSDTIFEQLDAMHEAYPFFDFQAKDLDEVGLAKWLNSKLAKMADKIFRHQHSLPSDLVMQRDKGDTVPYQVSLDDYEQNQEIVENFDQLWSEFLSRCEERTSAYKE